MLFKNKKIENFLSILKLGLIYLCLFISSKVPAQGITISSGNLVSNGPVYLVIDDAGFTNNATFNAGSSNVVFTGTATTNNSFIAGSSVSVFNDISINKSANGVQLNSDINLNGKLFMQNDSLFLNGHNINMATSASIIGENAASQITSPTGGNVIISAMLNSPNSVNPGNIGIALTSAADLGSIMIKRGDKEQTTPGGGKSILRYYDIIPSNNTGLNASAKFFYNDAELNGINEPELNMYASADGGISWIFLGKDGSDLTNDWLLKNGINSFNRLTLASNVSSPLPVRLISFSGQFNNSLVQLYWQTSFEQNTNFFNIERSDNGTNFTTIGKVNATGNSNVVLNLR